MNHAFNSIWLPKSFVVLNVNYVPHSPFPKTDELHVWIT